MSRSRRTAALFLLIAVVLSAQGLKPGPQVLTFLSSIDDSDQPYGLYLPKDYDAAKKYPLVISLHGAYSNHRLNLRRVFGMGNLMSEADAEATRYFPRFPDVDYIVASPLARGTLGYQGIPEKDVYDVLADVKQRFSIDDDRIYLTGLSMGGGGTLWMGLTRPDIWAAIAAVCPMVPDSTIELAPNALNLPVRLFHGAADPVVPVSESRMWKQRLTQLDTKVEYTEYSYVRHNSWDYAYKAAQIFDWFGQFRRNRHPDRVRFVTEHYKYDRAYWVRIDSMTPGTLASIDAQFTAPNRISVKTDALDGFSLQLAGHPKYSAKRPLQVVIDGAPVAIRRGPLSFDRTPAGWKQKLAVPPPDAKRPGLEGPISEAVSNRHIYVYGTADSPGADDLRVRRELAEQAAAWDSERVRLLLTFRVLADKDVKPSDMAENDVVLLGTAETNSVIAQIAARLPVELNAGAADYGLLYVYPNGTHYVLINSGLPWWTGSQNLRGPAFKYLPVGYVILKQAKDFLLFRGSIETSVVSGTFDRNWKLPPTAATAMLATHAVRVKPAMEAFDGSPSPPERGPLPAKTAIRPRTKQ